MPKKVVEVFYFIFMLLSHSRRIKKQPALCRYTARQYGLIFSRASAAPAMDTATP